MSDEIELISDGDGLAVIGQPTAVERFLRSQHLESREIDTRRLSAALGTGAAVAESSAAISADYGRWVKLTKESAESVQKIGLRKSAKNGLETGVIRGPKGQIKGFVEFASSPTSALTNPAVLSGAAGIMTQMAMQQAMDEITDYLAVIDAKVDDILRAQKDSALAEMIGVELMVDEAMHIRHSVGRVSEVTWSKVQGASTTIAVTQSYALKRLEAAAERLEKQRKMSDIEKAVRAAETDTHEWLAVLARCFQLQDALAVLELDRVLDASADELDDHRAGLQAAREQRMASIAATTKMLLDRISTAGKTADTKLLLHPSSAPQVVQMSNRSASRVVEFRELVGVSDTRSDVEERRWRQAAAETRNTVLTAGGERVGAARQFGSDRVGSARAAAARIPTVDVRVSLRRRGSKKDDDTA